jgi:hypothetical protein
MGNHFTALVVIHSLSRNEGPNHPDTSNTDTVTILEFRGNNDVVAGYKGRRYRAVFNPFVGSFYVDDKYGEIV